MKKRFLMLSLGFVWCMAIDLQMIYAVANLSYVKPVERSIPISSISTSTVEMWNFKNFEIIVNESGNYFIEFWLQPATYANHEYTKFYVYINDSFIGYINPASANWQSACIDGIKKVNLREGRNVITIATKAPETPEVESVKVSKKETTVRFSTELFRAYVEDAISGKVDNILLKNKNQNSNLKSSSTVGEICEINIPLCYSMHKTFTFTAGQDIFITSSSMTEHSIDVFFYGTPKPLPPPICVEDSITSHHKNNMQLMSNAICPYMIKPYKWYTPATSMEIQGLNWKGISEHVQNSDLQVVAMRIKIPKTGMYFVRLRSNANGVLGVVDLNINGNYYYKDAPIFFSSIPCEIPADSSKYVCITQCNNRKYDDPLLFMHGSGIADRVVGFDDDAPKDKINEYGLSWYDSYISQEYFIKTNTISISNYSSLNPVSTCTVRARLVDNTSSLAKSQTFSEKEITGNLKLKNAEVVIPSVIELNSVLSLSANTQIIKIRLFDLSGKCISSINAHDKSLDIPFSALNISSSGIYIVHVETENDIIIKKIIIK